MRKNALIESLLLISVGLAFFPVSSVQCLYQDEITLTLNWSSATYYQGDGGSVTISLRSTCGDELEFTWIGIHFAWMREDYYYPLDLSSDPIKIPSGGSTTFSPIYFHVDPDASVGWTEYYIRIHYNEHHWHGWASGIWTSSTYQLYIHDAYEKSYHELRPTVYSSLENAKGANYEAPDAKSLVSQAQNEYDLAVSLASQKKWESAVSHLQIASNKLVQASAEEEQYQEEKRQQELENWRQQATNEISTANQRISELANCESSDAKSLRSQAQSKLSDAQNSFDQATISSYKNACTYASQATSYADQASAKEQEFQEQKRQQQLIMMVGGISVAAIVIIAVAVRRRGKSATPAET